MAAPRATELKQLYKICERFVVEQKISGPEYIYQMDNVIQNAYEFIENICNVTGYYDGGEE